MAKRSADDGIAVAKRQKTDRDKEDRDDVFRWEEGFTDLQLKVEGKLISVNRGFLMTVSPVFKKMFLSILELVLSEVEKVDILLPLASEYQTCFLMARCEDFLIRKYFSSKFVEPSRSDLLWLLHTGVHFNRRKLEAKAMEHLIRFRLHDVENNDFFCDLPKEYQFELFRRRIMLVDGS